MKLFNKQPAHLIFDGISFFVGGLWLFSPWSAFSPDSLAPIFMPLSFFTHDASSFARASIFVIWLIPLWMLLVGISACIPEKLGVFSETTGFFQHLMRMLVTAIMTWASVLPILTMADSPAWFAAISPMRWTGPVLAIITHMVSTVVFLSFINWQNPVYREYHHFRKDQKNQISAKQDFNEKNSTTRKIMATEILFRIRSKLFFAFIGIFSIILITLTTIILGNYRETILDAVGDTARSLVEQSAAAYRINLGDEIALLEYITRQNELNDKAEFSFHDLTLYTNLKEQIYLDELPATLPEYRAEYASTIAGQRFPEIPAIGTADAIRIAEEGAQGKQPSPQFDSESFRYIFNCPIIKIDTIRKGDQRIRKERLLGFSVIRFDEAVIMRPYFRTRIAVISLTTFFLYISIILTYVVGNYIVNPLLFLRMSVRKISDVLTLMIRGETRVSANAIIYQDCVTSRDEIKSLSTEINEMVTVIRGIVPYISASTLKQAEIGTTSSVEKDLTFLFTDIRGFTTLCEGMEPDQVVDVLNRYLDLETEIILNNHGDVDKFVGDEMMAFFDGPDKEKNACRAAIQIKYAMMEEKDTREKEGLPVVSIGIGINTGPVVFGSVGARERKDFTSIGDTVNLAARLEGANKAYGSKTLISEAVWLKIQDEFLCREIDFIAVKGKTQPVRIFEILHEREKASETVENLCSQFQEALTNYRKRNWKKAEKQFKKIVNDFDDDPSKVYLERIDLFQIKPPADDWDGVFRMTVK